MVATAAAEIERPERNLPLSMLAAVIVATVLYVAVMLVSTGVLPSEGLHGSTMPLADVAVTYAGDVGATAMVAGAVLATISSANASILSAGRISFALGDQHVLPEWLESVHDRFGTPHRAVLATGVGIVLLAVLRLDLDLLAEVASFLFLLSYGLVHVAVVRLRRHDDAYDPTFRIPDALYPAGPVVGVLATAGIMTQMEPLVIGVGLVVVVAAAAWHIVATDSQLSPSL